MSIIISEIKPGDVIHYHAGNNAWDADVPFLVIACRIFWTKKGDESWKTLRTMGLYMVVSGTPYLHEAIIYDFQGKYYDRII